MKSSLCTLALLFIFQTSASAQGQPQPSSFGVPCPEAFARLKKVNRKSGYLAQTATTANSPNMLEEASRIGEQVTQMNQLFLIGCTAKRMNKVVPFRRVNPLDASPITCQAGLLRIYADSYFLGCEKRKLEELKKSLTAEEYKTRRTGYTESDKVLRTDEGTFLRYCVDPTDVIGGARPPRISEPSYGI